MNKNSLIAELKKHPWIILVVLVAHVALAILLSINLSHDDKPPMPAAKKHNIIDAVAVDATAYDERNKQKELEEKRKRDQQIAAEKKRKQELARKKEQERKKAEEAKRKQAELKKKQEAERKKQEALKKEQQRIEKEKQLALAKKKEAEKKERERKEKERLAKLEAERLEKQRLEKERLENERLEKERIEKERLEAERRRLEEEQRRAEEKAEFERAMLEEERMREEAARQAERAAKLDIMRVEYISSIAAKVERSWLRPAGSATGQSCVVRVNQTGSGEVIDVQIQSCNGDTAFQRSVERAVVQASPLPLPRDPELFDREIIFTFKPGG